MSRTRSAFGCLCLLALSLTVFPRRAAAGPGKPEHLPIEATLTFNQVPRPGEKVQLAMDVAAVQEVHGLAVELQIMTPSAHPTEWLDGLTSEAKVIEEGKPWRGDLAAGAHTRMEETLVLPEVGVYHVHGVVWGKGASVGGGGPSDSTNFYDTMADLWVRVGAEQTIVTKGESIAWTRQWNSTFSTVRGDDIPEAPVTLSLSFEKLPALKAAGILLVKLEARDALSGLDLDLEMPSAGVKVESVERPHTAGPSEAVTVEPGGPVFDVRWKGTLAKGEATTLRVPVGVKKTGWDVLRLYVSGARAAGAPGWATHKEMILVVDDVVTAARERVLEEKKK